MSEATDDTVILHVDMDAFFAAVEQRDNPELRGKPVIVGAPPDKRGVVSTCSYEARQFGVHSAMPSRTAYKLCPQGIFVPPRFSKYQAASQQIREIFSRYTPQIEPLSIDEAFLDVTGSHHLFGGPLAVARRLKDDILRETGLTASVGVAPNKFLAKLASDLEKPDGLTVVPTDEGQIAAFLAPLPVRRIWGVGKKSEEALLRQGLRTVGDLQRAGLDRLVRLLGDRGGRHVHELAFGRDSRIVDDSEPEKSVSHEHTFGDDVDDWAVVENTLVTLAAKVGARLRKHGWLAGTAHIKLRWGDFTTITRQTPLSPPTHIDQVLIETAQQLLAAARQRRPVRLIGFGTTALVKEGTAEALHQPDLFAEAAGEPERDQRRDQLDHALDDIRKRFGDSSIRRGPS